MNGGKGGLRGSLTERQKAEGGTTRLSGAGRWVLNDPVAPRSLATGEKHTHWSGESVKPGSHLMVSSSDLYSVVMGMEKLRMGWSGVRNKSQYYSAMLVAAGKRQV